MENKLLILSNTLCIITILPLHPKFKPPFLGNFEKFNKVEKPHHYFVPYRTFGLHPVSANRD
jgi:hypothetical protein